MGIRLAPFITARGMNCPEILDTILQAASFLQEKQVSYIHLAEADWDDAPKVDENFRRELRKRFTGKIIVAGKFDKNRADAILAQGYADLVAFGRPFIANPDFPYRLQKNIPLAELNPAALFGGTEKGYSDFSVAV